MFDEAQKLVAISTVPSDRGAFNLWLTGKDAIAFLLDNAQQDQFVVYAVYEKHLHPCGPCSSRTNKSARC
jgi:hypothetical protein